MTWGLLALCLSVHTEGVPAFTTNTNKVLTKTQICILQKCHLK